MWPLIEFVLECEGLAVVIFVFGWIFVSAFRRKKKPDLTSELVKLVETGELPVVQALDYAYNRGYDEALDDMEA